MIRKIIISLAVATVISSPAMAAQAGLVFGSGGSSSSSAVQAGSSGSSGSAIIGVTGQQSSAGGTSYGGSSVSFNGPNVATTSGHTVNTAQQGTSYSLGLAGSQNSSGAQGAGNSTAGGQILGGWVFVMP
jgi:hypothetical protein